MNLAAQRGKYPQRQNEPILLYSVIGERRRTDPDVATAGSGRLVYGIRKPDQLSYNGQRLPYQSGGQRVYPLIGKSQRNCPSELFSCSVGQRAHQMAAWIET